MKRISQQQAIFYRLIQNRNDGDNRFLSAWEFQGFIEMPEFRERFFMSYECSARLSEMYSENPGLLERKWMHGRRHFYGYRIAEDASAKSITDASLRALYKELKQAREQASWKPAAA